MLHTYSSAEMLAIWRRALGFETAREECSVEAYEGVDVAPGIKERMRRWYLRLLDTAPPPLLPCGEMASSAFLSGEAGGWGTVTLPDNVRRVLSVKLSGWNVAAMPCDEASAARRLRRMASPFGKPGPCEPLVIVVPNGLQVYPLLGTIDRLCAVVDPGPDTYILDESLLSVNC